MLDYTILKLVWWVLVCVLLIGFAIMDGHDMGVGALLPFLGRTDDERRVILNTVGPHWEGNQVWFITAVGAIFAAWPLVYATAFSGFYFALMAVLWACSSGLSVLSTAARSLMRAGARSGTGACSSAAPCRRWYLVLPSAMSSPACRSTLKTA